MLVTAFSAAEWDGPKTTTLTALGVHRAPGGTAIGQALESIESVIMKDGKPGSHQAHWLPFLVNP